MPSLATLANDANLYVDYRPYGFVGNAKFPGYTAETLPKPNSPNHFCNLLVGKVQAGPIHVSAVISCARAPSR